MSKQEEDDLDDLDDLLDEFANQVLSQPPGADLKGPPQVLAATAETAQKEKQEIKSSDDPSKTALNTTSITETLSATTTNSTNNIGLSSLLTKDTTVSSSAADDEDPSIPELDEEFAQKFKLGVDYLLEELNDSPEAKESFETLMAGLVNATGGESTDSGNKSTSDNSNQRKTNISSTSKTNPSPSPPKAQDFHDTIAQTMDRLKESKNELDEKATAASQEDDFLLKMMKELEGAAGSNGPDLNGLLGEMLKELSSKEILYAPMKEMHDKFPGWLKENGANLPKDEKERYQNQQRIVSEICGKFEDPKYSDDDDSARTYIAERMEEMQNSGAPPQELMGELASGSIPGLDLNSQDAAGLSADEGCPVQ